MTESGALHVAIDLGAGSGRALVGGAGASGFRLPRRTGSTTRRARPPGACDGTPRA